MLTTVLKAAFIILNIMIVVIVLKQDAKERGFSGTSAARTGSYLEKTGRRSSEQVMVIATRVMIIMYAAIALALLIINSRA